MDTLARAPGGQMRGAATKAMSDIVEAPEQAQDAPLSRVAGQPAGFVARSSHTAPGIARRSRLASGPEGLQQNANLFLCEPLDQRNFKKDLQERRYINVWTFEKYFRRRLPPGPGRGPLPGPDRRIPNFGNSR